MDPHQTLKGETKIIEYSINTTTAAFHQSWSKPFLAHYYYMSGPEPQPGAQLRSTLQMLVLLIGVSNSAGWY